ncbi:glycosyltransferase [Rubrobacter tropicus]|uniref:glycosyltransferase n=1 Tax=Rubrobacter tropicus TaxID=2653851 RepID=UPI001407A657|nr:nucleotide disphospho-sugar-binding domain-containing protein [Rubrobacter tropicus]
MRIVVTAAGSRGDVQPCAALGLGLKEAGHEVILAGWEPYRTMAESRGLAFWPVAGPDPDRLVEALVAAGRNPFGYARRFRPLLRPHVGQGLRDCLAACEGADAVIYTPLGFAGFMAAEHLGLPSVGSVVTPLFIRDGGFPSAMFGKPLPLPGHLYNRLSHPATEQLYWRTVEPLVAEARREVGLPAMPRLRGPLGEMHRQKRPFLLGWSPHVLPTDGRRDAWMHTTGYWFLGREEGWRPPEKLRRFLEAGEPPVALGLGSMGHTRASEAGRIVSLTAEALRLAGLRGVLVSDYGDADADLHEDVIRVPGGVPYDWLFPKVSVAVHHGGAGTTAEALRAGTPSVVVPVVPDQQFWGWRVHALGVSPAPISHKKLTAENLSSAILQAATDPEIRQRCENLGSKIKAENGVAQAVRTFERYVQRRP